MAKKKGLGARAFRLQNKYRGQKGVRFLKWHKGCRLTAKAACLVIIRRGELRHDPLWYRGLQKIFNRGRVAENIGWGYDDPDEIVAGWIRSPDHEKNMSNRELTHGAIATIYSRKLGKRVWVSHFAEKD